MSHSAVITLAQTYKETLSDCESSLEILGKIETNIEMGSTMKNDLKIAKKQLTSFRNELKTGTRKIDTDHLSKLDQEISSTMKRVVGLRDNLNFVKNMEETIKTASSEQKEKIEDIIFEYGYAGRIAIDNLVRKDIDLNEKNIKEEIESLLIEEQNAKNKSIFMKNIKQTLKEKMDLFSPTISGKFYSLANTLKSAQEFNDYVAYVESKYQQSKNMMRILKEELIPSTKKAGLKPVKAVFLLKDDNRLVISAEFKDSTAGILKMELDENQQIKYQMGNYKGHLCHTKADIMLESVAKNRAILKKRIVRDYTGQQSIHSKEKTMKRGK